MFLLNATTPVMVISGLEKWYYVSQIAGTGILILTAFYARKQYEDQKKHLRIVKAAELSKHFKDSIIPSISKLLILQQSKELKPIIHKIDLDKISLFNYKELCDFITSEELKTYKAVISIKVSSIPLDELKGSDATFSEYMMSCLNDLEYVCIHFNSNIADSDTVYQSLHQAFFILIQVTYIFIASQNTSSANKFYTNTIEVYKKWRNIYNSQLQKERDLQKKYSSHCDTETIIPPTYLD